MDVNKVLAKSLIFEITQKCTGNCVYCYNVWKNNVPYPEGELSTRKIKKLLQKVIKEVNANLVTLTGGEPLIRRDLEKIVKFLKDLHTDVNIITNATLLNEKRIKKLVSLGVSIFELPLLSDKREVHNKLQRIDSFDKITEAIVKIKKYNGKVVTVFVGTKENIDNFEEMIKLSIALGADGIMFNRFNPGGEGAKYIKELLPTPQQVKSALKIANRLTKEYKISISCSIPIQPCVIDTKEFENLNFGFCAAGGENAYYTIDSMGNLRMCNHSQLILGNLFKETFKEIVSKKIVNKFISAYPDYCNKCEIKNTCLGGCKASSEVCYGSILKEEPFLAMYK